MSTATLIRSPADCIDAVLRNLEMEAEMLAHRIERFRCEAATAAAQHKGQLAIAYDDEGRATGELLKQVRDHQALIRTECAALLGVHADSVPGAAL